MYCKYCGRELASDERYCPACGAEQTSQANNEETTTIGATSEVVEPQPAKVWSILSKVGKILSIVSIATSWVPFFWGMVLGIPGIVLSCLGRKAKTEVAESNYRLGLKLSIAGIVISVVIYIVVMAVLMSA
ncbi:MAG: zinc-ribbon domain-containing protein [Clostridiales bacterium]|nr:zinc-ribbon domain-containing protein [Clostridiales bacterium]